MNLRSGYRFAAAVLLIFCVLGCQKAYYAAWEKLGKEKRHLLKDQVESVRDDQQKATREFKDALTQIKEIYGFDGGDLEKYYKKLNSDYETCANRAETLGNRIDKVEQIAADLFREWEREIKEIGNDSLKAKSAQSLKETRIKYAKLQESMVQSRKKMQPVLKNLNDYTLYLKHNLNAQAIGVLRKEVGSIEQEVEYLIRDISKSVQETEHFLRNFE